MCDVLTTFILHSFIHYKDLYSDFSRGTSQKRSQPQHGRITLIQVVQGMFESGFWDWKRSENQGKIILD